MVTIEQIAEKAGVSRKTAYQVLSGGSKATRRDAVARAERIRQVAADLDYRPNAAARAMSTGRFGALALIHSASFSCRYMPEPLWVGLHEGALTYDQHIISTILSDTRLTDNQVMPRILQELAVDGLLIDYVHEAPDQMIGLIENHHLPVIWVHHRREHDSVYPDDIAAGLMMTRKMLESGHRRIAYASRRRDAHYSVADRREGYTQAMHQAGLQPVYLPLTHGIPEEQQAAEWETFLKSDDLPTAIVCYGGGDAMSLVYAAAKLGIAVPEQLSVASVAPGRQLSMGLEIAAVNQRMNRVGRTAISLLMEKIRQPHESLPSIAITGEWHPGHTIAPPNQQQI